MSSSAAAGDRLDGFLKRQFPTFDAWIGNMGWPILLRQLRADFRKNRFFLSQLICLAVLAIAVIGLISTSIEDRSLTATQIGQQLFSVFFAIQYLIILVIFPAFSSTSFTEEKAGFTMDFLLTSTFRPTEIVWGKFLASTVYCLIYVLASIPLLSIAFLFGGITLSEVLVAYAILLGLTLWISMLGVCVSSCFSANIRSTLTMYSLVFFALVASAMIYGYELKARMQSPGVSLVGAIIDCFDPGSPLQRLAVLALLGASFAYLFLIAANRIRPPSDDKSSPLRGITFLTILCVLLARVGQMKLTTAGSLKKVPTLEGLETTIGQIAILLFVVTMVFPTEEVNISRRNRFRFARWRGLLYPLRIFAPGAFWGSIYSFVLALLVCGSFFAWRIAFADFADQELDRRLTQSLVTLPLYLGAFAGLGFFLSACEFTSLYSRLTVFFVFIITLLLPVIFMLQKTPDAIWTFYYLSPLTLWSSLGAEPPDSQPQFVLYGLSAIDIAKVTFGAAAVAFFSGGVFLCRRAGHPLLRFTTPRFLDEVSRR